MVILRQQPRHTMDSILAHLATSIMYDMAPKAFLEKYLVSSPVLQVGYVLSWCLRFWHWTVQLSSFVKIQSIEWDGLSHYIVSYCRQSRSKWTHTLGLWFARWISFYFSRFLKSQTTLQIFSRVHEKLIFEKLRFSWAAALRLEQCSNCVKERYIFVIFQDFPVSTFICYLLLISVPLNEYVWLDHA